MEENEVLESVETPFEENQNQDLANDALAMAYDYYDRYYEKVLENMKTITDNQSTIIVQQESVINQQKDLITFSSCTLFVIALILIYNLLRNMVRLK